MTAFDRTAARAVLEARLPVRGHAWGPWIEGTLDELEGCVPPQSIDRDALRSALVETYQEAFETWNTSLKGVPPFKRFGDYLADRLLTTIRDVGDPAPAPPSEARERLVALLFREGRAWGAPDLTLDGMTRVANRLADRILALVEPAEGVTLTHREAQTALGWYADAWGDEIAPALYDKALARKLGDAS